MTDNPTFQELLTSQEARESADWFHPRVGNGTFWMNRHGDIFALNPDLDMVRSAIWQGWLTEAAPPPEPRVFKRVEYRNVYADGRLGEPALSRYEADQLFKNQTDKGAPGGGQQAGRRCGVNRFDFEVREECWDD